MGFGGLRANFLSWNDQGNAGAKTAKSTSAANEHRRVLAPRCLLVAKRFNFVIERANSRKLHFQSAISLRKLPQFNENSFLFFVFLNFFFLSLSAEFSVKPKFKRNFSSSQNSNSFSKRANLSENELFVFFSYSFKLKIQFANVKSLSKKSFL